MDWDDRRRLARDIAQLTAPDLQGVLLRCHLAQRTSVGAIDVPMQSEDHAVRKQSNWQLTSRVDLDALDNEVLLELRKFVDACYVPKQAPLEQCEICCGLWSNGRVLACGNHACSTRIHEECYGNVLRDDPNGPWFCPSCAYGAPLQCCLCLREGGALKPTSDRRWAHAICALAIPELTFRDVPTLEPIDGIMDLDPSRFRTLCNLCKRKGGAVVLCEEPSCATAYHVYCAAEAGLWIGAPGDAATPANPMALFCDKHLPTDRLLGAKRFVSDEDLALEAIEAKQIRKDNNHVPKDSADDYGFIMNSTALLLEQLKWSARVVTPTLPSSTDASTLFQVTPRLYSQNRFPIKSLVPEAVARLVDVGDGVPVFPPPRGRKIPDGPKLVGGLVEVFWKGHDAWHRARVLEYCPTRQMNHVKYLADGRDEWLRLVPGQCHVLRLASSDVKRIKLVRYKHKDQREWRPKPMSF
ncbi:hypothetical protein SPRG_14149 [Saprolegnia parasitica CBS 223.65]|uniref:PHD-type domain-containing protein n=1 Tax=Saprolegnia parasitica (strain CBS 223.65) TaxID=695850 RepID=A0A067BRN2_SAPPC|nr:hypothetical protein SPRG_14149 [Saprolegnia parasitica CBS 223.65]KDO20918.1 hypothetical protein SPRG_14149 [Saprolegnia parasitica CBS 223.65]|eukprot:XP_012208405.1 hypothetical protein SPRG_14149 [Saprolegnia parasitica CBS 223.65]